MLDINIKDEKMDLESRLLKSYNNMAEAQKNLFLNGVDRSRIGTWISGKKRKGKIMS